MQPVTSREIQAHCMRGNVRPAQDRLHARAGVERPNVAVLVVPEAIEQSCSLRENVIQAVGSFNFSKRLINCCRAGRERPPSEDGILQITPIALSIDKPEQLVWDQSAAEVPTELLLRPIVIIVPGKARAREVAVAVKAESFAVDVVRSRFCSDVHQARRRKVGCEIRKRLRDSEFLDRTLWNV